MSFLTPGADPEFESWVFKISKDVISFDSSNFIYYNDKFKTKIEFITSPLTLGSVLISLRPTSACSPTPNLGTTARAAELWRPYYARRSGSAAPWPHAPCRACLSPMPLLPRSCYRSSARPRSPYCRSSRPTSPYLHLALSIAPLLAGSPI